MRLQRAVSYDPLTVRVERESRAESERWEESLILIQSFVHPPIRYNPLLSLSPIFTVTKYVTILYK